MIIIMTLITECTREVTLRCAIGERCSPPLEVVSQRKAAMALRRQIYIYIRVTIYIYMYVLYCMGVCLSVYLNVCVYNYGGLREWPFIWWCIMPPRIHTRIVWGNMNFNLT